MSQVISQEGFFKSYLTVFNGKMEKPVCGDCFRVAGIWRNHLITKHVRLRKLKRIHLLMHWIKPLPMKRVLIAGFNPG